MTYYNDAGQPVTADRATYFTDPFDTRHRRIPIRPTTLPSDPYDGPLPDHDTWISDNDADWMQHRADEWTMREAM